MRRAIKCAIAFAMIGLMAVGRLAAQELSLTNLLAEGELCEQRGETQEALKALVKASELAPNNAEILCRTSKLYLDCMHGLTKAEKKPMAEKALEYGLKALKADDHLAKTHVCVAICYAKNFPYIDNQTKVNYSRQIKTESEAAIALDPKFDVAYHMLGRWNFEVANMGFFMRSMVRMAYGGLPKASKETAIENFKKAIELAPGRVINHLQLARMYHVTGQEKLVTPELELCVKLTPMDLDDKDAKEIAKKILTGAKWPEKF